MINTNAKNEESGDSCRHEIIEFQDLSSKVSKEVLEKFLGSSKNTFNYNFLIFRKCEL